MSELDRWSKRPEGGGIEDRAGALLRSVRPVEPSPDLEARVQEIVRGGGPALRFRLPIPALAAVLLALFAGGAGAATIAYRRWIAPEPPPVVRRAPPATVDAPPPAPEPAIEPAVEPPPAAPVAVVEPPPVRRASAIALESKVLGEAVALLQQGDPNGALHRIERYEREHPRGELRREAVLTKVTALVALDRLEEALAILDAIDVEGHPRAPELFVLRGELRARAGRCDEALVDLGRAAGNRALEERIARGIRHCRPR
jgi:hypothetical protein